MTTFDKKLWIWGSAASLVASITFFSSTLIHFSEREKTMRIIEENNYIKDRRTIDKVLSEADRYLKVTAFYSEIASVHWKRHSPEHKNNPQVQGLHQTEKSKVYREMYELSRLLDLPYMAIPAAITLESGGRPKVETEWEVGICQHRFEAVGQAKIFFDQLPSVYKKRCAFVFNSMEDLKDPINAIRIEAVLVWGMKRMFQGDQSWYITAKHWGLTRIWKYHKGGVLPPREFKFNVGTIDEDIRLPFTYYFAWNEYFQRFSAFEVQVNIPTPWIDAYRKKASRLEWEYITLQRDIRRVRDLIEKQTKATVEYEKDHKAKQKEIERLTGKMEDKYREWNKMIKRGEWTTAKEAYLIFRKETAEVLRELVDPKVETSKKVALYSMLFALSVLVILAGFGAWFIGKKSWLSIRRRWA